MLNRKIDFHLDCAKVQLVELQADNKTAIIQPLDDNLEPKPNKIKLCIHIAWSMQHK